MKTIKLAALSLLLAPVLAFAQVDEASAGLRPDSPFYFFDRIGEAIQRVFTFNPEAKAKLEISFAAERISEIKVILESKGIDAKGLDVAEKRLADNLTRVAGIVEKEKNKGKDVSELAKKLTDDFEARKDALEDAFENEKDALEVKIEELKNKIKEAQKAGDSATVESLSAELGKLKAQKETLSNKIEEKKNELEESKELLEKEMNAKEEAAKKIAEAEKKMTAIKNEEMKKGIDVPSDIIAKFDTTIAKAKAAYDAGNYDEARNLAKEAKKIAAIGSELAEKMKEERELEDDETLLGEEAKEARQLQFEMDKKLIEINMETEKKAAEEVKREDEKAAEELKKQLEETMEGLKKEQERMGY